MAQLPIKELMNFIPALPDPNPNEKIDLPALNFSNDLQKIEAVKIVEEAKNDRFAMAAVAAVVIAGIGAIAYFKK